MGHSNFYFMDGARCWRGLWVPLFTDVRAVLVQDLDAVIDEHIDDEGDTP